MKFDKDLRFTPGIAVGNGKVKYSDHYAILVEMKDIPLNCKRNRNGKKTTVWNTNKEGGWKRYEELTSNNNVLEDIADIFVSTDPNDAMKQFSKEMERIKYISFNNNERHLHYERERHFLSPRFFLSLWSQCF